MIQLTPQEARVFGVLIEKGFTTPNQYPLSLNAIATGSSQLSNRHPVMQFTEDQAFDAAEGLRNKQLAVRVDQVGSRVHKYKHIGVETLRCRQAELAILAELLLRGPQTIGELRARASRMQPFESLERVTDMLRALMERDEPLVKRLPPAPGSRAEQYAQLLAPDAHPISDVAIVSPATTSSEAAVLSGTNLADRVAMLEAEVATLRAAVQSIATSLGIEDPTAAASSSPPTSR
jgi:uncharacterized protein YceH (UPF0502 family)